jgi:hypothetical protein
MLQGDEGGGSWMSLERFVVEGISLLVPTEVAENQEGHEIARKSVYQ